ncbi:C4-type zinc ribbon domain-containing protein [Luteitalea sp.]|uniref:zinc ribbon domain-containing protein n=1 Tax=Luteitalea sp. TaxID=2004800 RepID=UPI0025BAB31D|nr:C4-type zinc ribbon domain-containing protein [Luteitalea sp.]
MHPSLEQLHRLQDLERQAAALRADIDAVDQRRREIEAPVVEAQQALDALTSTIEERQTQRRAGDRDVAASQQRLTKFRQQLMAVTNSREYEAVQHEIATVEAELKSREDQTITLLFELDDLAPKAEDARRVLAERKDAAGVSLAGLADETQRHRLELAALDGSIAALRPTVDAAALATYDRTAKRYPRFAVAELKGDLCVGCNVKIRPMLASEVRRGEKIVQCENCTRLLYVVKPPAAVAPPA